MGSLFSETFSTNSNLFIEASAGTGKTFTLEHLVIKRLLEPYENRFFECEDIAVVTFTRACAHELKERIGSRIEEAKRFLKSGEMPSNQVLASFFEKKTEEERRFLKRRLDFVAASLDRMPISTIHSFAAKLLIEYYHGDEKDQAFSFVQDEELLSYVEEYLTTSKEPEIIYLIELLLPHFEYSLQKMIEQVTLSLEKGERMTLQEGFKSLSCTFEGDIEEILYEESSKFLSLRDRAGMLKEEVATLFHTFAALFQKGAGIEEWIAFLKKPLVFQKMFQKRKKGVEEIHPLLEECMRCIDPITLQYSEKDALFKALVFFALQHIRELFFEKRLFSLQTLSIEMKEALGSKEFCSFLHKRYRAICIDEFQDTDPLQWEIFDSLLNAETAFLYLVGDPKQAIYAFRNADVYNFMRAKKCFSENERYFLQTNFRSQKNLVHAYNHLFSHELFSLPQTGEYLENIPLDAAKEEEFFSDTKGAVHFFGYKGMQGRKRIWPHEEVERALFSYIAKEIIEQKCPLSDIAILVKDRFQARRCAEYLEDKGIPFFLFRREAITESPLYPFFKRLLKALTRPRDKKKLIQLVSEEPFSSSSEELATLHTNEDEGKLWGAYVVRLSNLKQDFETKGMTLFIKHLREWLEPIIQEEVYADFEQFLDLFIEYEREHGASSFDEYLHFLHGLEILSDSKEKLIRRRENCSDAVTLVTMHKSKGLEYNIVFALGLCSRTPFSQEDIAEYHAERMRLLYVSMTRAKKRLYLPYLEESSGQAIPEGYHSPMELFLHHHGEGDARKGLEKLLESSHITYETIQQEYEIEKRETLIGKEPIRKNVPRFVSRRCFLRSFSQLRKKDVPHTHTVADPVFPVGVDAGILLHELLEEKENLFNPSLEKVQRACLCTELEEYSAPIYEMLNTLQHLPLQSRYKTFSIKDLKAFQMFSEADFIYLEKERVGVQGTIDFYFEFEGEFYIIDWKTHHLDSYEQTALQQYVKDAEYTLQAKLYVEALERSVGKPVRGTFFVFVRGPQAVYVDREEV